MRNTLLLAPLLLCGLVQAQNAPIALDDFFSTMADSTLTIEAPGVLSNDSGPIAIEAVLVSPPSNGDLDLASDGSFVYTPKPGFSGTDTFNYVAQTVDVPEQFVADPLQSGVRMFATLNTTAGSPSDDDSSAVSGTITAEVVPNTEPFTQIQVSSMDLVLSDGLSLTFGFSVFGSVNVDADRDSLALLLATPGPVANVSGGSFVQAGNELGMAGRLDITADGLVSTQVPSGPQTLDVAVPADLSGSIVQTGTDLTLSFPLYAEGSFDVSGNTVDVILQGAVSATGPVVVPLVSGVATVGIVVAPSGVATEDPDGISQRFGLFQNFPNPSNRSTMITFGLPSTSSARLSVYDALGRRVATPVDGVLSAGTHNAALDVSELPMGMYFYVLEAGNRSATRKLIVLR